MKPNFLAGPYKRSQNAELDAYPGGAGVDEDAGIDEVVLIYPGTLVYPGSRVEEDTGVYCGVIYCSSCDMLRGRGMPRCRNLSVQLPVQLELRHNLSPFIPSPS